MSGIIGGVSTRGIAPLTERESCGIPGRGHPGTGIAPLLSRKTNISDEELKEKIKRRYEQRYENRGIISKAK
jgi:hypothetical protein